MVAPSVAAVGTQAAGNSNVAPTVPAGVVNGSLVLLFGSSAENTSPLSTSSPGFTLLHSYNATAPALSVWWKRATGPESGTYNVGANLNSIAGFAVRIANDDGSSNPFGEIDSDGHGPSTSGPPLSLASVLDEALLMHQVSAVPTRSFTPETGFTRDTASASLREHVSHKEQPSAGGSGTVDGLFSGSGGSSGILFAINPVVTAHEGSATGSYAWSGSSTGTTTKAGSATGAYAWGGTASGAASHEGTASGGWTVSGTASGESAPSGSASGGWNVSGTATGSAEPSGSASGDWEFDGAASGERASEGSASGGWAWSGAASGSSSDGQGSASGAWRVSGTASGQSDYSGSATGGWEVSGETTGETAHSGSASGGWAWSGSASGDAAPSGSASGGWTISGTASGTTQPEGSASGGWAWSGSAQGFANEPRPVREPTLTISANPARVDIRPNPARTTIRTNPARLEIAP